MKTLATVVEGHGEIQSVPVLLRRVAGLVRPEVALTVPTPFRLPRGQFTAGVHLERAVSVVSRRVGSGGVLVLADADDECPVALAANLAARLEHLVHCRVAVVLANREYEAWFLASLRSLRAHHDVRSDAEPPEAPETVRDAKGALAKAMVTGKCSETRHQPAFSELLDLEQASACRSFKKFVREVELLLDA